MADKKVDKKLIEKDTMIKNLLDTSLALNEEILNLNKALSLSQDVISSLLATVDMLYDHKKQLDAEDILIFRPESKEKEEII